jgi:HK97 family phage major capsid protein
MAYNMLSDIEQKALSEGTDTAGGFLVPPDVQAEILVRLPQSSVMRRLGRVVTTSRDKLTWPRVQAKATDGSIYSSGFVGGWVGETPAFSDTDPAFGTFEIAIKKARVATKLGNDFLSDAAANVLAFLAQNGAENMGLVEDNGFIAGLGTPLEPLGVLEGGATTVDVEGSVDNTFSNNATEAAAATGSAPKLITLVYTLPSQYANGASWLMRRATEGNVRKFEDANGRPLWPPLMGSGLAAAPREILSYPVNNSEFMPAIGADAKIIIFGDLSNYIIAQRAQITTVVLRERFADTDQTGIILFERVGGALWNEDAIRIGALS